MTKTEKIMNGIEKVRKIDFALVLADSYLDDCKYHSGEIQDAIDNIRTEQKNLMALLADELYCIYMEEKHEN